MKSFKDWFRENSETLSEALITFGKKAYPDFGQIVILAGGAGCYPKGTEFFTGRGWKPIDQYQDGDSVLQYDPASGSTSLTTPTEFVDLPADQFYQIKNRRVDFTTSQDHKHLVINEKTGAHEVLKTHDLVSQHNNTARGNKRKLVTSFGYSGPGINMTDDEIRLKVAVFADGHILGTKEPKVRVSLKKDRKIDRFRYLLDCNEIEYREYEENGFTRFEFKYDTKEKEFESYWYDCSQEQFSVVIDEIINWDGSVAVRDNRRDLKSFHTNSIKSRDFIQFAFSANGYGTSIYKDIREGQTDCYGVYVSTSDGVGISKNDRAKITTEIRETESTDGRMYCFTVPTGFFVVRQNGKIYVSGNSGKGFVLENLIGIEGHVLDVDALKGLAIRTKKIRMRAKEETGYDLRELDLKDPEHVKKLHEILADDLGVTKANQRRVLMGALAAPENRKPNLIFDVTLKDMAKVEELTRHVSDVGYTKRNIHLVWVLNDVEIASEQNKTRDRVVPEEILMATHRGASMTMADLMDQGASLKRYLDGDMFIAFNNKDAGDTDLVKRPGKDSEGKTDGGNEDFVKNSKFLELKAKGGAYLKSARYIQIKEQGKTVISRNDLSREITRRIADYTPDVPVWGEDNE